jgi:site-specific recombinase XerC
LSARQAQNRFDKWKTPAGIRKDLTIHSFRAGFANRLFRTTGNIHLVARAMGHSDIRSTELYIEKDISVIREAVEDAFEVR